MKSIIRSLTALAFVLALTTWKSHAQILPSPPGQISYQGFLTDANGIPLATNNPINYTINFGIWDSPSSGTNLWLEQQVVTVDRGYFTVMLGNGSAIGGPNTNNLTSIFSGGNAGNRYLEITVLGLAPGDPPIAPRLRFLASPYTYLASQALSVAGTNSVPDSSLSANIALRAGGNTFSGSELFNNSGALYFDNTYQVLAKNTTGTYETFLWPRYSDNITYLNYGSAGFNIRNNGSVSTMFMGNNGNVGIGTSSLPNRLSIYAPNVADGLDLWGSAPAIYLGDVNNTQRGAWGYASSGGQYSTDAAAGDTVLRTTSPGRLILQTGGGSSGLVINNNSVGIGTPSPGAKLDVRGDVKIGAAGTMFASGSMETLRIVRGIVRNDGTIFNGAGFTVTTNGVGSYTLNFNPPFADVPAVVITPSVGASAPLTATWNDGNPGSILIETWSGSVHASVWFQFVAIGGR